MSWEVEQKKEEMLLYAEQDQSHYQSNFFPFGVFLAGFDFLMTGDSTKNICQSYVYGRINRFCWQHTSSCSTFLLIAFLGGGCIIFGFKSGVIMTWIGIINSKEKIVHNRKSLYEKTDIIESLHSESMLVFLLDRVNCFSWWALDDTSSPTYSKSGSTEAWTNESI